MFPLQSETTSVSRQHDSDVISYPQEQCAWCWLQLHPDISYPEHWSGTICPIHAEQLLTEQHLRKSARQQSNASHKNLSN